MVDRPDVPIRSDAIAMRRRIRPNRAPSSGRRRWPSTWRQRWSRARGSPGSTCSRDRRRPAAQRGGGGPHAGPVVGTERPRRRPDRRRPRRPRRPRRRRPTTTTPSTHDHDHDDHHHDHDDDAADDHDAHLRAGPPVGQPVVAVDLHRRRNNRTMDRGASSRPVTIRDDSTPPSAVRPSSIRHRAPQGGQWSSAPTDVDDHATGNGVIDSRASGTTAAAAAPGPTRSASWSSR